MKKNKRIRGAGERVQTFRVYTALSEDPSFRTAPMPAALGEADAAGLLLPAGTGEKPPLASSVSHADLCPLVCGPFLGLCPLSLSISPTLCPCSKGRPLGNPGPYLTTGQSPLSGDLLGSECPSLPQAQPGAGEAGTEEGCPQSPGDPSLGTEGGYRASATGAPDWLERRSEWL